MKISTLFAVLICSASAMSTAEEKSVTFPLPTPKTDREGKTTIQSFETSSKGIRYIVEEQRDTYGRILTSRKFTAETISGFLVEDADLEDAEKVLSQFSSDGQVYIYKGIRMFSFRVDASDIGEYSDLFSTVSELEIVEKIDLNEAISPQVSTTAISINDPYFSSDSLWHLENAGSGSNVAQADISATWAWYAKDKINTSGLLAIIDTGVIAHNDLPSNYVYTPPPPTPPPPTGPVIVVPQAVDYYGTGVAAHGTWMAGVASAKSNNSLGVAGVAPNSNVANLNVYDPVTEEILSSSVAAAVEFAVDRGAKVISISLGHYASSPNSYHTAMANYALDEGVIIVTAAGNGTTGTPSGSPEDIDTSPFYPAALTHANIVSVTGFSAQNNRVAWLNYGDTAVDIAAPGTGVWTTSNASSSSYLAVSGTSIATPMVATALAMARERFPSDSYSQLIQRLEYSRRYVADLDYGSNSDGIKWEGGLSLSKLFSPFSNIASATDSDYRPVPWFDGWILDNDFPWIYHTYLGWIWSVSSSTSNLQFHRDGLGWMQTSETSWPSVYSYSTADWMLYLENTTNPMWFYDYSINDWISVY